MPLSSSPTNRTPEFAFETNLPFQFAFELHLHQSEESAGAAVKLVRASEDAVRAADYAFAEVHQQYLTNALSQPENQSSTDHYLEQQQYGEEDLDYESCVFEFNETLLSGVEQDFERHAAIDHRRASSSFSGERRVQPHPSAQRRTQANPCRLFSPPNLDYSKESTCETPIRAPTRMATSP